jgi:hypothetical protein
MRFKNGFRANKSLFFLLSIRAQRRSNNFLRQTYVKINLHLIYTYIPPSFEISFSHSNQQVSSDRLHSLYIDLT